MQFSSLTLLIPLLASSTLSKPLEARQKAAGVNQATLTLIETEEGFRANFYNDQLGEKTIGYGHDCVQLGCDGINAPITKQQGQDLLKKDIGQYESCVCGLPNAKDLNANQYGALVSFTYNSGCQGAQSAWQTAMQNKAFQSICTKLPTTNTKGGVVSGRRQKEANLCKTATSAKSGC